MSRQKRQNTYAVDTDRHIQTKLNGLRREKKNYFNTVRVNRENRDTQSVFSNF